MVLRQGYPSVLVYIIILSVSRTVLQFRVYYKVHYTVKDFFGIH